jgi:hypothetical protein
MTTALATLLICIAGAALVIAVGTYFWVNRRPSSKERFDRYGRVPLFGVTLTSTTPNDTAALSAAPVTKAPDETSNDRATSSAARSGTGLSGPVSSGTARPTPVTPLEASYAPANQDDGEGADEGAPKTAALGEASPRSTPVSSPADGPDKPAQRPGGNGWGERPGWPTTPPRPLMPSIVEFSSGDREAPAARASLPVGPASRTPSTTVGPGNNGNANGRAGNGVYSDGVAGSVVEAHGLRFSVPPEGTLQFLPGRLEISAGLDTGREIRFVHVPGPNGTEVTFGRNEGPLYRHIQLRDQTVSREHARMTLFEGQWSLANLSRTNPVALNGRILGLGEQQTLQDGDRVEMGEVVFSFRSR